jgi:hypothetical protein
VERLADFARLLITQERRVRASLGTSSSLESLWPELSEDAEWSGGIEP